jgi:DNA mismatch repair protein MutS
VPIEVTKRADEILKVIENDAVIEPLSTNKKSRKSAKYTQLIFFDGPGIEGDIMKPQSMDPVLNDILRLDIDSLTPREALNRLAEFQKILKRD